MAGDLWANIQGVFGWLFFAVMAGLASVEPRESVWIMASAGSLGSVLWGEPRGVVKSILLWGVGMFFAIAWTNGIDHFDPAPEAFFTGLGSIVATRIFLARFGTWAAGLLSTALTGGSNRGS